MQLSAHWLQTWVDAGVPQKELIERLSMAGLEVEAVTPAAGAFSGVLIAEILTVSPHPNADKLRVCSVFDGKSTLQIVCGAPNARVGLKVALAQQGAELPDILIKAASVRGVESHGMLCSAGELHLAGSSEGILELPSEAPVGQCLRQYLDLDDVSIEINLTPNRGDCLSVAGIAREVSALYAKPVQPVVCPPVEARHNQTRSVVLKAPHACPRYLGRIISGVNPKQPTPLWMVQRLARSGHSSISAIVDITNYVMLELGQPMHAFDLGKLQGDLQVRMATADEPLTLLNGQTLALRNDTLVIADQHQALALAGIMGGSESAIQDSTQDLFLESAFFDPVALAGKARSYGLHTESSHRFERGVDPELAAQALERATSLLLSIVGGVPGPIVQATSAAHCPERPPINLRSQRIQQMLGLNLADSTVEELLNRLQLTPTCQAPGHWLVAIPSYRFDLSLEVDLIEELARLYGYNHLPVRYPQARLAPQAQSETRTSLAELKRLLSARGYQEAITYSFIDPKLFSLLSPNSPLIALANPISTDLSVMRDSLWPGLLKATQYNLNRQQSRVRLFESGLRFTGPLEHLQQEMMLAGLSTGSRYPENWSNSNERLDFYDLKADVSALLGTNAAHCQYLPAEHPALHPGQSARIEREGKLLGYIGALHPQIAQTLGFSQSIFVFELTLASLQQRNMPRFAELSRFPEVRRDLAIVVPQRVLAEQVLSTLRQYAGPDLIDLCLFDVYTGKGIAEDCKSLAVGLTWQHASRTLNEEEINALVANLLRVLQQEFNAQLRT